MVLVMLKVNYYPQEKTISKYTECLQIWYMAKLMGFNALAHQKLYYSKRHDSKCQYGSLLPELLPIIHKIMCQTLVFLK